VRGDVGPRMLFLILSHHDARRPEGGLSMLVTSLEVSPHPWAERVPGPTLGQAPGLGIGT